MYSYDFQINGDIVGFRCLDQEYIWIDKEDMTRVLSAEGYWFFENNRVILKENPYKQTIFLEDYLLYTAPHSSMKLTNHPFDFRKRNLTLKPHAYSPFFIRPSTPQQLIQFKNVDVFQLSSMFYTIRKKGTIIGFFFILPIKKRIFQSFIKDETTLNCIMKQSTYDNSEEYHHILTGNFPNDAQLLNYIYRFYKNILLHLSLRSITITDICFNNIDSSHLLSKVFQQDSFNYNIIEQDEINKIIINTSHLYEKYK